ncbi:hypothetical protein QKW35_07805 [Pontibacterium granulatum]|uniref:helix-turn-helix domain-containing protein n=1 Tax=Pontibacterium granulatum TaxID=2036029 RepID=UPI00249B8F55|nr:helix-turn-helix domain-containing protein [Pontibacterium granulatum]MDI3324279.1 hypothetical protein [Pontibacterium granulatum]
MGSTHTVSCDGHAAEALLAGHQRKHFRRTLNFVVLNLGPYLAKWRMQEVRDLMINADCSMGVIAETSGYQSEAALRKAFRAIAG